MRRATLALPLLLIFACADRKPNRPSAAERSTIKNDILEAPPAKLTHKVNADFQGKVVYLGMDVDTPLVRPGKQFGITHYWQVKQTIAGWKTFVHLDSAKDPQEYFVNADHTPLRGSYPEAMWRPGEIIRDRHEITLPKSWDALTVNVYVGLWKGSKRLEPKGKHDGNNRLLAGTLKVAFGAHAKRTMTDKRASFHKRIVAVKTETPLVIDGKLDEPVWQKARSGTAFVNVLHGGGMRIRTTVKLAWNDRYLFIAFHNVDADIWSSRKERDENLWAEEAVRALIDANGDGEDYIELQVNPLGTVYDSYLRAHRQNDDAWNSKVEAAVVVDGTLGNRSDKDKGWNVEIALPWQDAKGRGGYRLETPTVGSVWRANFFRMERPRARPPIPVAWSAPRSAELHELERFGNVVFGDATGKAPVAQKGAESCPHLRKLKMQKAAKKSTEAK